MPLMTGSWALVANGHQGELIINSVPSTGIIGFDIAAEGIGIGLGQLVSKRAGFWDESSQLITLHITTHTPVEPVQFFHNFAFEGYQYSTPAQLTPGRDITWTLVGHFSMTGATPILTTPTFRRHRFGWSATITQTV
jgi:hypothetical protein